MLSILIPAYNYDITKLVTDLHIQAISLGIDFEIVAMEDGSQKFLFENKSIKNLLSVKYTVLKENIGRSAIRNCLIDNAIYPYALFLDCDSEICRADFLEKYLKYCHKNCVVSGGRIYKNDVDRRYSLLAKYGKMREQFNAKNLKIRDKYPVFTTPNFLIDKNIFQKIRFDESLKQYGHEDTLFGLELQGQSIDIQMIDNPVYHTGLDDNNTFLHKTELALQTLFSLYKSGKYPLLSQNSKIISFYKKLEILHLIKIIYFTFRIFKPLIIKNLTCKNPSLLLFDFYRLGILCGLKNENWQL
ncbi:MAG: glycosyltransferase [Prevotellaceae bacterium]|nr:glycosyltransferase [Prevotellaceae bacterium]